MPERYDKQFTVMLPGRRRVTVGPHKETVIRKVFGQARLSPPSEEMAIKLYDVAKQESEMIGGSMADSLDRIVALATVTPYQDVLRMMEKALQSMRASSSRTTSDDDPSSN